MDVRQFYKILNDDDLRFNVAIGNIRDGTLYLTSNNKTT